MIRKTDGDNIRDKGWHDKHNTPDKVSNEELVASWGSRIRRGKPTWQMEREMRRRGILK